MSLPLDTRFTRLLVVGYAPPDKWGHQRSLVLCDCGTEKPVLDYSLIHENTKSCGCLMREMTIAWNHAHSGMKHPQFVNMAGVHQKDGKLRAVRCTGFDKHGNAEWLCDCDCGGQTTIIRGSFESEATKSCGCIDGVRDLQGQQFGDAAPQEHVGADLNHHALWLCAVPTGQEILPESTLVRRARKQ